MGCLRLDSRIAGLRRQNNCEVALNLPYSGGDLGVGCVQNANALGKVCWVEDNCYTKTAKPDGKIEMVAVRSLFCMVGCFIPDRSAIKELCIHLKISIHSERSNSSH